mmetsp:Transcript_109423/g.205244  ORF Transcript_109423/g.205244 Transcript_109423/m.205244 type:complete len:203 (+) Transcript_109423:1147-1755(+)
MHALQEDPTFTGEIFRACMCTSDGRSREANVAPLTCCTSLKISNTLTTRRLVRLRPNCRRFAKVTEKPHPATTGAILEVHRELCVQCKHPLATSLAICLPSEILHNKVSLLCCILVRSHKGNALGILTVTSSSAALLHIVLQRLHSPIMHDAAYGGLVDSHAEGNSSHDHLHIIRDELPVGGVSYSHAQARVIWTSSNAARH